MRKQAGFGILFFRILQAFDILQRLVHKDYLACLLCVTNNETLYSHNSIKLLACL